MLLEEEEEEEEEGIGTPQIVNCHNRVSVQSAMSLLPYMYTGGMLHHLQSWLDG